MNLSPNPCGTRSAQADTRTILTKPRAFQRICSELRRGLAAPLRFARQGGFLAGLLLIAASPAAQANLIVNGSFEDPTHTGPALYEGVPLPWSRSPDVLGSAPFTFNGELGGVWPAPQDGDQFVDIGFGTAYTLSQAFTVLVAGTYLLAWYDNAGSGSSHNYSVEVDGDSKGSFSGTGATDWTLRSLTFALSAGSHELVFVGGTEFDTFLDNVSLEAASVGSVPDSGSSFAMISSAFAGICLLRRRPATC